MAEKAILVENSGAEHDGIIPTISSDRGYKRMYSTEVVLLPS